MSLSTPELQTRLASGEKLWISITGLRLKKPWLLPIFWWFAVPSFRQAVNAPGCLLAETQRIDGVFHTLSVWESRKDVKKFVFSDPHRKAVRSFSRFFTGHIYGYEANSIPDWPEAHRLCLELGRPY